MPELLQARLLEQIDACRRRHATQPGRIVTSVVAPEVSTRRTATRRWGRRVGAALAIGLPAAFSAPSCTHPAGSISSSAPQRAIHPRRRCSGDASSGWENSALRAGTAARQSPSPETSA